MESASQDPLISVVVPVYNTEKYLKKCLQSVADQTFKNFECIIVIDGSPDNSISIAEEFSQKDKRFFVQQKENGGLASARNLGMKKAKGEFISFLDSDDYWNPEKLERQIHILQKNSSVDLVFSHCYVKENEKPLYLYGAKPFSGNPLELLHTNNVIGSGSSVIIRRKIFESIGGFNESLKSFEDLEYWFRIAINKFRFQDSSTPDVVIIRRKDSLSRNHPTLLPANLKCFKLQLDQLLLSDYPLKKIREKAFIRVEAIKKYFTKSQLLFKFSYFLRFIGIYFLFEIRFRIKFFDKLN